MEKNWDHEICDGNVVTRSHGLLQTVRPFAAWDAGRKVALTLCFAEPFLIWKSSIVP